MVELNEIKISQELISSPVFSNPIALKVFLYALLKAPRVKGVAFVGTEEYPLEPGQMIIPHLTLASLGAKSTDVITLGESGLAEIEEYEIFTVIKIKNWGDYIFKPIKKKVKVTPTKAEAFDFETFIAEKFPSQAVRDKVRIYREERLRMKPKPMDTFNAWNAIAKLLSKVDDKTKIEMLERATASSWKSVFYPNGSKLEALNERPTAKRNVVWDE